MMHLHSSPPGQALPPPDVPTRHPSMFSAPVPCASTLAATVPVRGLRATTTGSKAGLPAAGGEFCGVALVALSIAESARVERELRTPAANRLSAAVASDDQERGSRMLCAVTLCMIDDRQDDKVCRSVVLLDAVDVVDVLVAS